MRLFLRRREFGGNVTRKLCSLVRLFLYLCVVGVTSASAQDITVKGTVKDPAGLEIIGANVVQKGTTNGTMTDANGEFTLTVPEGKILAISYIGYKPLELKASPSMKVVLAEDNQALDEVVVVGYGSSVKKDLTTAVTSIKSKDFLQGASNSPMQMIDGKVAGVSVSNTAAADPNASPSVQVRGASSLKAGNGPLVVIDGMPGGDLRNLAQQDIESITVLKDGSAAAIYGSRGANGVILVQTKQGKAGKVSITYDGYAEHDFVAARPEILSAEEFLEHQIGPDRGSRTNWYDELLNKKNFGQNHNVSLSGGSETSVFRLSANYRTKEGLDIATDRKEYGLRASFKQTTLEGMLEVGGNVSYRVADEDYTSYGVFKQAVELNPTFSADEMEAFKGSFDSYNPIKFLTERENGAGQEYISIDLNVKLNILKNLNTELKLGRQGHNKKQREYYNKNYRDCINDKFNGWAKLTDEKWVDYTLEWLGNYSLDIDKHHIKVMGGYSYQEFNWEKLFAENKNFPSDAFSYNNLSAGDFMKADGRLGMDSDKNKEKTIAFLGRVNYDYDNLFLFTGSIRYEGNTKFGANHKWGAFPAASAAWRVSRLSVFEDSPVVDDLKLRFSYGETGRSGFDKYTALAKYKGWGWLPNSEGQWVQVYGAENNPNYDLSWEKQISYNLGVDYTLFNSRLTGSLDLFTREGKDVIGEYFVPMPPFMHDKLYTNVGSTTSKGFEFQVNWDAVQTKDFTYSTNVNLAYTKSKLKSFSNEKFKMGYMEFDGLPSPGNPGPCQRLADGVEIGSFYGYRYAGVDGDGNMLVFKGAKEGAETIRGDQAGELDRDYIGNGTPKWEMSWGNSFTYKGFDLSLFFRGRFDYQILNQYQMYYGLQSVTGINKLQSAYKENDHIKGSKVICDYFLENGNYLKLDNITIGWTPKLNTKWISSLRIYGTMKNVCTITNYSGGMDPASVNVSGLEAGRGNMDLYPTSRNISFGVQISY